MPTPLQFHSLALRHRLIPPACGHTGPTEPRLPQGSFTFLFTGLFLHCIAHSTCIKWCMHSQSKVTNLTLFQVAHRQNSDKESKLKCTKFVI